MTTRDREIAIPRRLIVTLEAYVAGGSHKAGAYRLGISESTSRQRVSELMRLIGARTAAEAVWLLQKELRCELPLEGCPLSHPSQELGTRR
jgi:DNA-binding NarL/FixJ family response regulator